MLEFLNKGGIAAFGVTLAVSAVAFPLGIAYALFLFVRHLDKPNRRAKRQALLADAKANPDRYPSVLQF